FLGHLLDRFDLEFFGVTLTTHGTSYLGLIMRLGGVYETRGDSSISSTLWDISLVVRTEGITDPEVASESIKPSGRLTTRSD
ncbi:hypothetical protein WCE04_15885, partial [Pseudomonas shirazica]